MDHNSAGSSHEHDVELKCQKGPCCSDLAVLTSMIGAHWKQGMPFMPWEIKSLDEKAILKNEKSLGRAFWIKHHQKLLTRVYPKGTRFDSSNYSPVPGWAIGA